MNYLNQHLCTACGGVCCKKAPGPMSPEDAINISGESDLYNALIALFTTGNFQIDWYERFSQEIDRGYYVRPTALDENQSAIFSPSWGGTCIFLTATGCPLEPEKRPEGCRLLEPKHDECLNHGGSRYDAAEMWLPYHDVLLRAVAALTSA